MARAGRYRLRRWRREWRQFRGRRNASSKSCARCSGCAASDSAVQRVGQKFDANAVVLQTLYADVQLVVHEALAENAARQTDDADGSYHKNASFLFSVFERKGNFADQLLRELDHFAVVGDKAVALVFHIAQLRVDAGSETFFLCGNNLLFVEPAEGVGKGCFVPQRLVAEAFFAPSVTGDGEGVAAELRQRDGRARACPS